MRPRVLIAEDHPEMTSALAHLIEPSCDIVGTIADGSKVVETVARLRPDVLVVDLNLPGLNGLEVCRRTVRAFPAVDVIVITAEVDEALVEASRAAGAAAFVAKLSAADALPAAIAGLRPRP